MMEFYITGGSNSVLKEGWTRFFVEKPKYNAAKSVAVGASGSAMGAFRTIFTTDLQRGDSVIWEYALNDALLVQKRHPIEFCLRYTEYTIRHCLERGANFYPLVFRNQSQEQDDTSAEYFRRLISLFDHYALRYVDVSRECRRKFSEEVLPDSYFLDRNHYATASGIVKFIADLAEELIEVGGNIPDSRPELIIPAGAKLVLERHLASASLGVFENSLMRIPAYENADFPWLARRFGYEGVIGAMIALLPTEGGTFRLRCGDTVANAQFNGEGEGDKLLLRLAAVHDLAPDGFKVGARDRVKINFFPRHKRGESTSDKYRGRSRELSRFVGFLVEKYPQASPAERNNKKADKRSSMNPSYKLKELELSMSGNDTKYTDDQLKRQRAIYLKIRLQELKEEIANVKNELSEMRSLETAE